MPGELINDHVRAVKTARDVSFDREFLPNAGQLFGRKFEKEPAGMILPVEPVGEVGNHGDPEGHRWGQTGLFVGHLADVGDAAERAHRDGRIKGL